MTHSRLARNLGGLVLAAVLAGCVVNSGGPRLQSRVMVVADEPSAALVGRRVLERGGTAADAAVAMALTMAVTLPSRVGLGGGGACLVFDPELGQVRYLDFMPRGAPGVASTGAAVPALMRGLAALHAEYGGQRLEGLAIAAENMARFGFPVSRALAIDVATAGPVVTANPFLVNALGTADGGLAELGQTLVRPRLADTLSVLRADDLSTLYGGPLGRRYAAGATAVGLRLDIEALRTYQPVWREPISLRFGRDIISFSPDVLTGGPQQALAWLMLTELEDYADLGSAARADLLLRVQRAVADVDSGTPIDVQTAAARLQSGPSGPSAPLRSGGAATLAVLSQDDVGIVCGLTMNGLFGSARPVGNTGILAVPAAGPIDAAMGGLAMWVNQPLAQFLMGGAASDTMAALMVPMLEVMIDEAGLTDAMAAARFVPASGNRALADDSGAGLVPELEARGYRVDRVPGLGRAALIYCVWDRGDNKACEAAADPRGQGLAVSYEIMAGLG